MVNELTPVSGEVRTYVFEGDLPPMTAQELVRFVDTRAALEASAYRVIPNMVTNVGRQQMVKRVVGETASVFGFIGLTTSATVAALASTALTNEITRKACSVIASYSNYYARNIAYFVGADFASTGIAGCGGFDTATTGGNMWTVASISLSKSAAQSALVEWRVNVSS